MRNDLSESSAAAVENGNLIASEPVPERRRSKENASRRSRQSTRPSRRSGPTRRIDAAAEERICRMIRTWPDSALLTWKGIVALVAASERGGWTRQAISRRTAVSAAFQKRKNELRKGKKTSKDPLIIVLKQQLADKDARMQRLEALLAIYEERYVTMIKNATVRGLTQPELEAPLLPNDRR